MPAYCSSRSESHPGRAAANAGTQDPPTHATVSSVNGVTMSRPQSAATTASSSTKATSSVVAARRPAFRALDRPGLGSYTCLRRAGEAELSTTFAHGGSDAESTTTTSTCGRSPANAFRQRARSVGRLCVHTTAVRIGSGTERLREELCVKLRRTLPRQLGPPGARVLLQLQAHRFVLERFETPSDSGCGRRSEKRGVAYDLRDRPAARSENRLARAEGIQQRPVALTDAVRPEDEDRVRGGDGARVRVVVGVGDHERSRGARTSGQPFVCGPPDERELPSPLADQGLRRREDLLDELRPLDDSGYDGDARVLRPTEKPARLDASHVREGRGRVGDDAHPVAADACVGDEHVGGEAAVDDDGARAPVQPWMHDAPVGRLQGAGPGSG